MWQTIVFVLVAAFAVFIQVVAGFGGTLISMPFGIMLVGVAISKPVLTIVAWLTGLIMAISGWKHIDFKELAKMTIVMLIGVFLGIWLFSSVSMNYLVILYAIVVLLIGLKKFFKDSSKPLPAALQWGSLGIAGLMQGLFVSGGSFLVVYATSQIKDKQVFRSTVNAVWAILNTVLIVSYFVEGMLSADVWKITGLCLIPTLGAFYLAEVVARKIKQKLFLKIAYPLLIVSGGVLLITNL